MANRKGKSGSGDGFYFGGAPKFSVDGDCSHEIKTLLLLGRKAMRNLDNMLKSKDITLPTKIFIVKTIVSLLVVYRCESWTTTAEHLGVDGFEQRCW